MSKIIAYCALLYGKDYLYYSIKSVIDQVDAFWVLYTPVGSHGSRTDEKCPDSMADLWSAAAFAAGHKLRWCNGRWTREGDQRDYIFDLAPDADLVLVVDSDEIWQDGAAEYAIHMAEGIDVRNFRLPMIHYWRSFYKAVLHDPAYPVRIIQPGIPSGERTLPVSPINHMGYAIRPELARYKWLVHGHKGEYRKDVDWYTDRYLANAQTDCHPVGSEYWNPEPVDPARYMPDFMRDHPFWGKDVIA